MAKAVNMGTFQGSNGRLNPKEPITRQEAFIVIARALKLKNTEEEPTGYKDLDQISEWANEEVQSLIQNGYVKGSNGNINPKGNITRAEFAQLMDNIIKHYIKEEGQYTEIPEGNIMINVPGVTLKDVTVKGDLIIGDGVGEGDLTLDNVEVTGKMIVRGGGENSIIIKGNSKIVQITVAKVDGNIRVYTEDGSEVEIVYIDDGKEKVTIEGNVKNLVVQSETEISIKDANIDKITLESPKSKIKVEETSNVKDIEIEKEAEESSVKIEGTVTNLTTSAPNTKVEGDGSLEEVNLQEGSDESSVKTLNTTITVDENVEGAVGTGDSILEVGTEYTNSDDIEEDSQDAAEEEPLSTTGGGGGDGSTTPTAKDDETVAVTGVSLDKMSMTLTEGGATGSLTATVSPIDATNKNVTWESSDQSVATVADGVITPLAAGTVTITVTTEDGSYTAFCEVTVIIERTINGRILLPEEATKDLEITVSAYGEENFQTSVIIPTGESSADYSVDVRDGTYTIRARLQDDLNPYIKRSYYSDTGTVTNENLATKITVSGSAILGKDIELIKGNRVSGTVSLHEEATEDLEVSVTVLDESYENTYYTKLVIPTGQSSIDYNVNVLDGTYKIRCLLETDYSNYVQTNYYSDIGTVEDDTKSTSITVSGSAVVGKDIRIIKTNTINGRILLPEEATKDSEITVSAYDKNSGASFINSVVISTGETSADYSIEVPNGTYTIRTKLQDNLTPYIKRSYYNDTGTVTNENLATEITVSGSAILGKDIELIKGNRVSGTVSLYEEANEDLEVSVRVHDESYENSYYTKLVIPTGQSSIDYNVNVLNGTYKIRCLLETKYSNYVQTNYYSDTGTVANENDATEILVSGEDIIEKNIEIIYDTIGPVITLEGNSTVNLSTEDTYTEAGATAEDNVDGDLTESIVIGGDTVDTTTPGSYEVTYDVIDTSGNEAAQVVRTVIVVDLTSYNEALSSVIQADYTSESWMTYQVVVDNNTVTKENTQIEIDEATEAITTAQNDLVLAIPVTRIRLEKTYATLTTDSTTGSSIQLAAVVMPEDANDYSLSWNSSNTAVATVDESGFVEAVSTGSAIVTVMADGYEAKAKIDVYSTNEAIKVAKSGGDYTTIQEAVNAAQSGDTILVGPGQYEELVTIEGKGNIILKSTDGANSTTIGAINTETQGIILKSGNTNVTVEGFTIIPGKIRGSDYGGIYLHGASGSVENVNGGNYNIIDNIINNYPDKNTFNIRLDWPAYVDSITIEGNETKADQMLIYIYDGDQNIKVDITINNNIMSEAIEITNDNDSIMEINNNTLTNYIKIQVPSGRTIPNSINGLIGEDQDAATIGEANNNTNNVNIDYQN